MKKLIKEKLISGFSLGIGFVLALGTASILAFTLSSSFSDGETLTASKLNSLFESIPIGTYCGTTGSIYTGAQVGGYTGGKAKCETACGSTLAHMCTAHEMSISRQQNITIPAQDLWISAFIGNQSNAPSTTTSDCDGWTVDATGNSAVYSTAAGRFATYAQCNQTFDIACCK